MPSSARSQMLRFRRKGSENTTFYRRGDVGIAPYDRNGPH